MFSKPSFPIMYTVLKPNTQVNSLKTLFTKQQSRPFELARNSQSSVRKYKTSYRGVQNWLQLCQWRTCGVPQINKCLYVQFFGKGASPSQNEKQVYIQHMEISLLEIQKLVLSQALYLLRQSLIGFQFLLCKFKEVSVNMGTIGLDRQGQCFVWLNSSLEQLRPQAQAIKLENEVIIRLIQLIKSKCQTKSAFNLTSLGHYALSDRPTIKQMLDYLKLFVQVNNVKIAKNLKHLVDCQIINNKVDSYGLKSSQTPRFAKRSPAHSHYAAFAGANKKRSILLQKLTLSNQKINQIKSSIIIKSHRNSHRQHQFQSFQQTARMQTSVKVFGNKQNSQYIKKSNSTMNTAKFSNNRCQTSGIQSVKIVDVQSPKKRFTSNKQNSADPKTFVSCKSLTRSKQSKQKISLIQQSEKLKPYQSLVGHSRLKNECKSDQKSKLFKGNQSKKDSIIVKHNWFQNSNKQNNQKVQPKQNNLFKLTRNLLWDESKVKTSMTLGQCENTYLSDIKLQKLDILARRMAISKIPQQNDSLYSQEMIQ